MEYRPDRHHRSSIRLKGYDYSQSGAYFVTICAKSRECLFGEIRDDGMVLNECGEIVREEWMDTGIIRSYVELDEYVVMPNHFHAILAINDRDPVGAVGARRCFARNEIARNEIETNTGQKTVANCRDDKTRATHRIAPTIQSETIGSIIGQFKSIVTKRINQIRNTPGHPVWQRNYYEHIIRGEEEMHRICRYIIENPAKWAEDKDNPENIVHHGDNCECPYRKQ